MSTTTPEGSGSDQYKAAVNSYRSNLKWVLSTFGTVGGILIVGLQLSSLGSLHGAHLHLAIICAFVGLLSFGVVVMFAAFALAPVGGTYRDFEKSREFAKLRKRVPWTSTAPPVPELRNQARDLKELVGKVNTTSGVERSNALIVLGTLTQLGILLRVEQLFRRTMAAMCVAVPLIAASAVGYAYFTHPPQHPVAAKKSVNCIAYYTELHTLAKDAPRLARALNPAPPRHHRVHAVLPVPITLDAQTKACGIHTRAELARALKALR